MQNWSVGYILTSFEASIKTTLLVSPRGNSARSLGERSGKEYHFLLYHLIQKSELLI